jgi:DNA-directed RNA polymerase subunit RPC12/RpoP
MTCALHGIAPCPLCDGTTPTREQIAAHPSSYACLDCRRELPVEDVTESGGHCGACGSTNVIPLVAHRPPPPHRGVSRHNMAVDSEGQSLPFTPEEVNRISEQALRDGSIVAAIIRLPSGDMSVQIFGPPSHELVDMLDATARAYRRVLKGQ